MIAIKKDRLIFRFRDVHPAAKCRIEFQRTLRIPDNDRIYPLPAGLGRFPLRHLDDFATRLPKRSVRRGGVVMPMYQGEALWINFPRESRVTYPCAVKVATGKVCAISGEPWQEGLVEDPQNYVVIPDQPWLDGYCVEKGMIRQFVAVPLGSGLTAEEQLTGMGTHGGLQIAAYPMKREVFEKLAEPDPEPVYGPAIMCSSPPDMGLAPGGRMLQDIYEDEHGLDAWDQDHGSRCFMTLANSAQWMAITGELPPTMPPTRWDYERAGLPWFLHYDEKLQALEGAERLASLKSLGEQAKNSGKASSYKAHSEVGEL